MRVPINWLKEFVKIHFSPAKLAEKLFQLGIEVERIEEDRTLSGIKIGKVVSLKKHPSADKLSICSVDVAKGSPKQIICGAPNVKKGIKVPVALPGTILPNGLKIEKRAIRGIESYGMICSEAELDLGEDSKGIWILPNKRKVGKELVDEMGLKDTILDVSLTPNRGDCLSILGIAREIAALTSQKLKMPEIAIKETKDKIKDKIDVEIKDFSLCPRYTARMITGIQLKNSPYWMRRRLLLAGVRPINNIVDITNYVMLETGQPLHAFDYQKIEGKKIIVRRAKENEKILCLDGAQRNLSSQALVIADSKNPIALAGLIGGEEAGVNKNTKDILLESANFAPWLIRRTSKSFNLTTESSYRFERGVDPEGTKRAALRACYLIQELAGGKVLSDVVDIKRKIAKRTIPFHPSEIKRILGVEIPSYNRMLQKLGFETKKERNYLKVKVPSWRSDVKEEIDLIEEIARINNYDLVPLSLPTGRIPPLSEDKKEKVIKRFRSMLNRLSLNEVINYSLIGADLIKKSLMKVKPNTLKIDNVISEEFGFLRFSLIPSLLQTAEENIAKGEKNIRIFELRGIYKYGKNKSPEENLHLGILLAGEWLKQNWLRTVQRTSFYVLKGVIETLLRELGIGLTYKREKHPFFSEACTFSLLRDGLKVGSIGEVNLNIMENFSLKEKTYISEVNIEKLMPFVKLKKKIKAVPKYPPVVRDISCIVSDKYSGNQIEKTILTEGGKLIKEVNLVDYYKGKQVPAGSVGMTYSISFRSDKKTLTDVEVTKLQDKIIRKLKKELGLKLRE
jgi:phenylalanyl-tRNA synthetase beta chain